MTRPFPLMTRERQPFFWAFRIRRGERERERDAQVIVLIGMREIGDSMPRLLEDTYRFLELGPFGD